MPRHCTPPSTAFPRTTSRCRPRWTRFCKPRTPRPPPEQKTAVLQQVAEQLRNAAEIIQHYQYRAQWDRFPADVAEQLADAHDQAQQIAQALDRVAPAFSHQPTTDTRPRTQADHTRSTTTAAASPPSPATRQR
ncbi:hypothetical protein [Streptomyces sp. NPDC088816]|uniref:hypothetical protein n=1 Tax=Streptomyces sp. NPDC088816 TaxID=3365906 RepID=UPI00380AB1CB